MFTRKPICEHMVNFLYDLAFLVPLMYGYATVSYEQLFDHLKLWPAQTAITIAVLKVNIFLDKLRWTDFRLKHFKQ